MASFKKTPERSKTLLTWLIEETKNLAKINKARLEIVRNEGLAGEEITNDMLLYNSSMYKDAKDMQAFCIDNIVSHHLNMEELEIFYTYKGAEDKTVNYQM